MKYVKQLGWILLFTLISQALAVLIPLPIPTVIYGIVLMLIALGTGIIKPETIGDTARFLTGLLPVLFVIPTVKILANWELIAPHLVPVCVIMVVSTVIVFAVSGVVTKLLQKKGGADNG